MNAETAIRREMTPDVLDATGQRLVDAAVRTGCGARFTGAGGGGCVWALGAPLAIAKLKQSWQDILSRTRSGCLLPVSIDRKGLSVTEEI